ncbi:hypothetical protein MKK88_02585 [Methylobacterium sp. E-005]|uniref:hypothetical protein n=1 Tax=Methylobacterium sp. E-005 TaxID=2836549 RepID=UPI001FBA94CE|nr:hypothetical protein [Methylobacterium sp. E-005]MCJ2084881.1 hypothetical protein [Methylobacterium sp. E-005]
MTRLSDDRQLIEPQGGAIRRWLAFALTAVALGTPIAGMFVVMWPFLLAWARIASNGIEIIGAAIVSGLIGIGLSAHIHRDRGVRP